MKKDFFTNSGILIENIYGEPPAAAFPFTRGIQTQMYRSKLWTMRQYAGFGSAEESNARYRYLLSQGQTGLSVAFDLPTQLGLDPDSQRAVGEVGKVGVSISTLQDMRILLKGLPLDQVSTSMTINATAPILLALYVCVAEEQGVRRAKLQGTVQNDLLKEFIARGNYIYPPQGSLKLTTDLIEFCSKEMPKWNPISISGYHIREAGATAIQEVAFTIANALVYVDHVLKRGLSIDDFAPRLSFFWNVHNEFFEEVAKFRAARQIWAKLVRERYKPQNEKSLYLRFHAQTAGSTLTAQQPQNNIIRVAYQAMAAVLGGCQSLHTNGFDEALALPTEEAARLALRTQQVLAYETGVTRTVDPVGGSHYVEALTGEIEKNVRHYLDAIERKGGVIACIESGYIQGEISSAAYAQQKAIENGELKVVGVNCFQEERKEKTPVFRIPETLQKQRVEEVQAFKANRQEARAQVALKQLGEAAKFNQNTLPLIMNAIQSSCTLGEISEVLESVFGKQREWTGI